jgi:hypothetical protein
MPDTLLMLLRLRLVLLSAKISRICTARADDFTARDVAELFLTPAELLTKKSLQCNENS